MKHILIITALILMASCTNKNMVSVDNEELINEIDGTYHIQVTYEALTDSSSEGIYIMDMNGQIIASVSRERMCKAQIEGVGFCISDGKKLIDTIMVSDDRFCVDPGVMELRY